MQWLVAPLFKLLLVLGDTIWEYSQVSAGRSKPHHYLPLLCTHTKGPFEFAVDRLQWSLVDDIFQQRHQVLLLPKHHCHFNQKRLPLGRLEVENCPPYQSLYAILTGTGNVDDQVKVYPAEVFDYLVELNDLGDLLLH